MEWIKEYFGVLGLPTFFFTIAFGAGFLTDNLSYKWKHWPLKVTIGAFLTGPSVSLVLTGAWMIVDLGNTEQFIFERWVTAASFLVLGLYLMVKYSSKFFTTKPAVYAED